MQMGGPPPVGAGQFPHPMQMGGPPSWPPPPGHMQQGQNMPPQGMRPPVQFGRPMTQGMPPPPPNAGMMRPGVQPPPPPMWRHPPPQNQMMPPPPAGMNQ